MIESRSKSGMKLTFYYAVYLRKFSDLVHKSLAKNTTHLANMGVAEPLLGHGGGSATPQGPREKKKRKKKKGLGMIVSRGRVGGDLVVLGG
jgi:hypothetical protein